MTEVTLECKLARKYALENIAGSLAYLLIKATPNPTLDFGSLPLNLGILIDVSRSMKGDKIQYAREASKLVVQSLSPDDMISIVIFSDNARAIVPHNEARDKTSILAAIDKIRTVSGTRMYKGIETAVAEMRKATKPGCINFMIILTDGETEREELCLSLAQQEMRNKLVISTFGIGDTYNEGLLKSIADATLGKIFHLQAAEQIKTHFGTEVDAARTAVITNVTLGLCLANDVKLEETHRIFPNSARLEPTIETDGKTYSIDINRLTINESSFFGVKMILPARPSGPVTEAQISFKYDIPNLDIKERIDKCDVIVEYTKDRDLCTRIDREVISYFNQLNAETLINQAIQETKVGNIAEATKILAQAQTLTQRIGNPALTQNIGLASEELNGKGVISPGVIKTIRVGASHTVKIDDADPKR